MARVAYDNVVNYFDLERLPGPDEVAGKFDVGSAGAGVAGRVVVNEND